jgi:glutamate/aspartate transport system substrate-binding protein
MSLPIRLRPLALLLALPLVLGAAPASAQSALEAMKARKAVVIGYRADAPPFSMLDARKQPTGYAVALCQRVAQRLLAELGLPATALRTQLVPGDQIERYLRSQNVDLLCSATSDTAERRRSMAFSPPIYLAQLRVAVRKKDGIASLAALDGKPVVTLDRSTAPQRLQAVQTERGLRFKLAQVVGADAALGQLKLGWAAGYARDDALLLGQLAGLPERADYELLPEALGEERIAIAYPAGDARLAALVEAALAEAAKSGAWQQLYAQWFVQPAPPSGHALGLPMGEGLKAVVAGLAAR